MKKYTLAQIYATTYVLSHNAARYIKARITHPEWFKKKKIIKLKKKAKPSQIEYLRTSLQVLVKLTAIAVVVTPLTMLCCSPTRNTIDFAIALISASAVTSIIYEVYCAVKSYRKIT